MLVHMARPAGFEPTTPWFVARYSIQLSYGRKTQKYISFPESVSSAGVPEPSRIARYLAACGYP
jgi:hypothetical protein